MDSGAGENEAPEDEEDEVMLSLRGCGEALEEDSSLLLNGVWNVNGNWAARRSFEYSLYP